MKKIASFSVLTAVALSAQILPSNILGISSLAQENGGTKSAIDAYSDGGGSVLIGNNSDAVKPIDNSPMNELVFKYGQEAKNNGVSIVDQVKTIDINSPAVDKALADKIVISAVTVPKDGTECDDGNANTYKDIYTNGVCSGVTNGTSCDDGNAQTINDVYTNGVCAGTNVENQSCNDGNVQTINDTYHNGVCTAGRVPYNCFEIYSNGARANGNYGIDFKRNGSLYTTYCDMTNGGWTLLYSFASSSSYVNLQGYYGTSIDSTTELSDAGITTYNTYYNETSYTIKSGYLQFFYSKTPIGYLIIPLPMASASNTVKVDWGNWYSGTSELYKVSKGITTLIKQINSSNLGAYSTSFSYTAGDSVKLTEDGITWVNKIWVK